MTKQLSFFFSTFLIWIAALGSVQAQADSAITSEYRAKEETRNQMTALNLKGAQKEQQLYALNFSIAQKLAALFAANKNARTDLSKEMAHLDEERDNGLIDILSSKEYANYLKYKAMNNSVLHPRYVDFQKARENAQEASIRFSTGKRKK